jgi:transcriptional regulator with XRE-family HTH domain
MLSENSLDDFGSRIKYVRNKFELSQLAFSTSLGISRASLSYYENNERVPSARVLAKIASVYGINREWLLTGKGKIGEIADSDILITTYEYSEDRGEHNENNFSRLDENSQNTLVELVKYAIISGALITATGTFGLWLNQSTEIGTIIKDLIDKKPNNLRHILNHKISDVLLDLPNIYNALPDESKKTIKATLKCMPSFQVIYELIDDSEDQ